jgi:SAM-dependent methyltransferase
MTTTIGLPERSAAIPPEYGPWLDEFAGDLVPGLTALDVGCGTGDDARYLTGRGLRVTGLDLDPARARHAANRAPGASIVVADLRAGLPFQANVFERVVASLSLHYFDSRTTAAIVSDLRRVARPGAILLARVNTVGDTTSRWGHGAEREPDYFEVEPGAFKRFFSDMSLRATLEPAFEVGIICRRPTLVRGQHPKQTLVVRAIRRND